MCAGVLQVGRERILGEVRKRIEESHYLDIKRLKTNVTAPRTLLLRSAQWIRKINSNISADNTRLLVSKVIPDTKAIISHIIEDAFPSKVDGEGDVEVELVFSNEEADCRLESTWEAAGIKRPARVRGQPANLPWPTNTLIENTLNSTPLHLVTSTLGELPDPIEKSEFKCQVTRRPLFIAGRYLKYDRDCPQTPWIMNNIRMGTSSVQEEIISPLLTTFFPNGAPRKAPSIHETGEPPAKRQKIHIPEAEEVMQGLYGIKFHSAGREDIDVRMFGSGRPFMLEIPEPALFYWDDEQLRKLEEMVNVREGAAEVVPGSFKTVSYEHFATLAEASESKQKKYRCVVWIAKDVHHIKERLCKSEIEITQKTPLRVLHRRSALDRTKTIHSMEVVDVVNAHWVVLDVVTSAGAYVKEFINGDRGRTYPSVASICGCPADILQLDVLDVYCDL
eukprot:TRINITY_DN23317_c0_g1_i1.p1 TRINITY_DN23317_c0_g1~~TRINITY_DN23317_c0_g1_i1.p1  ORF type:complete len:506 (+),score=157.62 TRINITY_DN23317_c0_g1_i1:173-1519(+)